MDKQEETHIKGLNKAVAWEFIILVGVITIFGDMIYEGGRNVIVPFL